MKQIFVDLDQLQKFAVGFDHMVSGLHRTGSTNVSNYPPYNIVRRATPELSDRITHFVVEVAVSGYEESELSVEVLGNELVIKGHHHDSEVREYVYQGIAARDFTRSFALAENVRILGATVKNGILSITLEHVVPEAETPQKIAITFQP